MEEERKKRTQETNKRETHRPRIDSKSNNYFFSLRSQIVCQVDEVRRLRDDAIHWIIFIRNPMKAHKLIEYELNFIFFFHFPSPLTRLEWLNDASELKNRSAGATAATNKRTEVWID